MAMAATRVAAALPRVARRSRWRWPHTRPQRAQHSSTATPALALNDEVAEALHRRAPVVALESTIISHGMPHPDNLAMARDVEAIVRDGGAVPATVAVMGGQIRVGLDDEALELLATTGRAARKCSRRDLALCMADGGVGATTVSGTMVAAHMAGVRVFVTGGIGGVHRGYEETMDASADITELGRTPVAVVCAGAKSILDIRRTLEMLETHGVTVATLGSDEFPAFFTPRSGHGSHCRLDSEAEMAELIHSNLRLGLGSGVLLAVPNESGADGDAIEAATQAALADAAAARVQGKDITPFLLKRVNELTQGASLESNIMLVKNNARVGAKVAVELAKLGSTTGGSARATSVPGSVAHQFGGVGRNVAEALARLGCSPYFLTVLGRDSVGGSLRAHLEGLGARTHHVVMATGGSSAVYLAVLDERGDMDAAIADMACFEDVTPEAARAALSTPDPSDASVALSDVPCVVADANMLAATLSAAAEACAAAGTPFWFEPTSVAKSVRIVESLPLVSVVSPSRDELFALAAAVAPDLAGPDADSDSDAESSDDDDGVSEGEGEGGGDMASISFEVGDAEGKGVSIHRADDNGSSNDADTDADDADIGVYDIDFSVLRAAHIVLSAMCKPRPDGLAAAPVCGGQHVMVTLGEQGVLWVGSHTAERGDVGDVLDDVPFFSATDALGLDFELLPPLEANIRNTTGAGDTFVGGAVWALARSDLAASQGSEGVTIPDVLRAGLAAAKHTCESDLSVSPELTEGAVRALLRQQQAQEL